MLSTILQIIFIASPQSALGIAFCLLITDKFDLINVNEITGKLNFSGKALLRLAFLTFIFSFLCIVPRHYRLFNLWVIQIALIIAFCICMVIVLKIRKLVDVIKITFAICLWALIGSVIEFITTPIIIYVNEITVYDVFDSFYLNFVSSVPSVVVFLIIDMALFTKKKSFVNISVIKSIIKSKVITVVTILLLFMNFLLMGIYGLMINDKVLDVYPTNVHIIMNLILMTFPALNLGGLWFLLYSVKYKEAMEMRIERDEMIRKVSVANERSRLARDVHDTLGHSLTVIIKLLEVCKITAKSDPDKINAQLEEAIKIAQNGVQEIKHSISGILAEKILNQDFLSLLTELAREFENKSGITVNVTTQGTVEEVNKKHAIVLYSVCQEALTNSLRHGNAKNIAIVIKYESENIKLTIFDDGVGCGKIQKGFGLNGMEQRIGEVNGKMSYKSEKGQGFILNFEVPKDKASMLK